MSEHGPTVFGGRYELHRRLARGGMADVYLARDQLLDRPVAVKVLFAEFATDPTFVERFRREAQAAANLNHPNIVSIYDWGEEAGTYYIVMEYVEGKSLAQLIRQEGRLHPDRAADIASEVASALGFAHSKSLAHRDVKPGNVLMSSKGEIKVADFGIATAMVSGADNNLTQTGAVMGTATYFSPEQAQGKPVDPRSDLYSLGVVLYEMLVGSPPFTGETPVSIAYKHVQESPVPPGDRGVDVPEALAAITMKLLAKNPSNRYPTSDDLRADLRRYRSGAYAGPEAAPIPTAAGPAPTAAQPTTAMPANAMPVGVPGQPAPGGAGGEMAAHGTQVLPQAAAYGPPERNRTGLIVGGFLVVLLGLIGLTLVLLAYFGGGEEPSPDVAAVAEQVRIESVNQLDELEAIRLLESEGFVVTVQDELNADIAQGLVVSQEPRAGEVVDFGSDVMLTISAGKAPVRIPDVAGDLARDGEKVLRDAGFDVSVVLDDSDEVLEGNIISQDPAQGEERVPGSTVTIVVSQGSGVQAVPDVSEMTFDEAKESLENLGFQVSREDESSDDFALDAIIRTDPAAGEEAEEAAVVQVFVSTGVATAELPNVVGLALTDAAAELQLQSYIVREQLLSVTDPAQIGVVVSQDPAAGAQAANGATVTLTVGVAAPATATPIPAATFTPIPATAVPTLPPATATPIPPAATFTPIPATAVPTLPPATATPIPPAATFTPIPATAVPTLPPATATPAPSG